MTRPSPVVIVTAVLVLAASITGAAAAIDDPRAYTDPSPRPIQEDQAAKIVNDELAGEGVRAPLTPEAVRGGVIVTPRPAAPGTATGRPGPHAGPGDAVTVRPASGAKQSVVALGPSRRAGVDRPSDPAAPNALVWVLLAAVAAAAAAVVAVARR